MMTLGGYTFDANPYNMPVMGTINTSSHAKTYTSVQRFDWGAHTAGRLISLEWELMTAAQYAALHALWVAGASVVFNPDITAGTTYNVFIENLTGEYWQRQDDTDAYRQNVRLELLLVSVV